MLGSLVSVYPDASSVLLSVIKREVEIGLLDALVVESMEEGNQFSKIDISKLCEAHILETKMKVGRLSCLFSRLTCRFVNEFRGFRFVSCALRSANEENKIVCRPSLS